jgi:hypothetical protein
MMVCSSEISSLNYVENWDFIKPWHIKLYLNCTGKKLRQTTVCIKTALGIPGGRCG